MTSAINEIESALKKFGAIAWSSCGYPIPCESGEPINAGWIKFGLKQSVLGWRTLEFLAWTYSDMIRAGERLKFFPTSPPPYLNTPGDCLSFVIECYPLGNDQEERFRRVASFIDSCREKYWAECRGDLPT
jgi:hypothetical protein